MPRWLSYLAMIAVVALSGVLLADGLLAQRLFAQGFTDSGQPQPAAKANSAKPNGAKPNGAKTNGKGKNRPAMAITPEREAAVLSFVERNHAELAGLLAHLKANQPKQYEQAVKEIYRVTERLAGVQERDPLMYELEVKFWTAQSQVQLLAARLKMGDTQEQRQQLREALTAQHAARLDVLKHQREQASQRLARMDEQIGKLEADRDEIISRQLETLAKAGTKSAPKNKPAKRADRTTTKSAE